ncbi:hypothetical protein [Candidatus Similichlamydia laticola]|uniref:Uncharacterized protein n=1 Tax=Candidatus Similichlamydia laticola TaxID=2170265 RepID=A0A369KG35_9BACT|nr:hypothetical protein [Candidatus Similichlamydia laticola]RDB31665.1 hypothetical protein HAT2_00276 [Candidatus Similichlamydia laticola]
MSSIHVTFISPGRLTDPIRIPLIDRSTLDWRIQDFARIQRNRASSQLESSWVVGRQLFQDGSQEVFSCPTKVQKTIYEVTCPLAGELFLFCNETDRKGITFCFFPEKNIHIPSSTPSLEGGGSRLESNKANRFSFPTNCVSCLIWDGWIAQNDAGGPSLRGIEMAFIQTCKGLSLFCRKTEEVFPPLERPMSGALPGPKYIRVHCFSRWKGFSFYVRIPLLTETELEERIRVACHTRFQAMGIDNGQGQECLDRQRLFPPSSRVFDLPPGMGISVLFGNIFGGEILCSYREPTFQIAVLSSFFERGEESLLVRSFRSFPPWQLKNQCFSQEQLSGNKIHIFSHHAQLQHDNDEESCVQDTELRLICTTSEGLYGLFISSNEKMKIAPSPSLTETDAGPSGSSSRKEFSPIQKSICFPCFTGGKSLRSIHIPLVDPVTLEMCIQESVGFKKSNKLSLEKAERIVCKNLLQDEPHELFFFPGSSTERELNLDLKLLSSNTKKRGFSLWYFPSKSKNYIRNLKCVFNENFFPKEINQAKGFPLVYNSATCLIYEEGWFVSDSLGQLLLKGISFHFVKREETVIGFLCQAQEELSNPERPIETGGVVWRAHAQYKKYVKVTCLSKHKGFSCQVRLPVLSKYDLKSELEKAISQRSDAAEGLKNASVIPCLRHEEGLFEYEDCLVVDFPFGMGVDVPFGGCQGGDLFLSFDGTHFKVALISDVFRTRKSGGYNRKTPQYPLWQVGTKPFHRVKCFPSRLYLFDSSDVRLVQVSKTEYCVEGAMLQLMIAPRNSFWGLLISKQRKPETVPLNEAKGSSSGFVPPSKRLKFCEESLTMAISSSHGEEATGSLNEAQIKEERISPIPFMQYPIISGVFSGDPAVTALLELDQSSRIKLEESRFVKRVSYLGGPTLTLLGIPEVGLQQKTLSKPFNEEESSTTTEDSLFYD